MSDEETTTFKERAKESLLRHGIPLEIDTHHKLEESGWTSRAEAAFEDPDEGKTRRVDFVAWKRKQVNSKFFNNAMITLVIECKKRENSAWIFYRTRKENPTPEDISKLIYRSPQMLILGHSKWVSAFHEDELKKLILNSHHLADDHPFVAIAGHEIAVETNQERKQRIGREDKGRGGKKQKDERGDFLYRASIEVTKALKAEIKTDIEHWMTEIEKEHQFPPDFEIYYPVIVFDGQLFEAKLQSGEIELDEVPYLQLVWETQEDEYIIDVVSKQHFSKYLEILDEELVNLAKIVESLKDIWDKMLNAIREIISGIK